MAAGAASCSTEELNSNNRNEVYKHIIDAYRPSIVKLLIPRDILSALASHGVIIDKEKQGRIYQLDRSRKHTEACELLLDTLCDTDEGWFPAFIKSLEDQDYQILVNLLKGEEAAPKKDYVELNKLLGLFAEKIEKEVRIQNILALCLRRNLINDRDREEIESENRNHGNINAVSFLLTLVYRKNDRWFDVFMNTLMDADYEELVKEIVDKSYFDLLKGNQSHSDVDQEDGLQETSNALQSGTGEFQLDYQEVNDQHSLLAPNISASQAAIGQDQYENQTVDSQQPLLAPNISYSQAATGQDQYDNQTVDSQQPLLPPNISAAPSHTNQDAHLSVGPMSAENNINMDSADSITETKRMNKNILVEDANDDSNEMARLAVSPERDIVPEELILRPYQDELAEAGLEGKNVVICAPTGSGKTHVALKICKDHLENETDGKILFFCNQVALVDQQYKAFRRYVSAYQSMALTGDNTQTGPIEELIHEYDILVLTPQILLDTFKRGGLDRLCDTITLMVFDECHHTNKKHQYNNIMNIYMTEKFSEEFSQCPQVIGLTASLGVGKANDMEKAVTHILKLCANLDTERICTVERHIDELKNHVSVPHEELCQTGGRSMDDRFVSCLENIMLQIEQRINGQDAARVQGIANFHEALKPPPDKGNERYTQWSNALLRLIYRIYEQNVRRMFLACVNHLMFYNEALIIADSSRAKDAMAWLKEKFAEASPPHFDKTDDWLNEIYKGVEKTLQTLCRHDKNPKLEKLKVMIVKAFEEKPNSHGIIFVKTRALCSALCSWMEETDGLKELRPGKIVGSNASQASVNGMTTRQQVNVLDYFKKGDHRILVATSVAEEGLDIRTCNLVIRYLHVTNEIAMVQARGRARAEDSLYVVVAETGSDTAKKESINIIRENLMRKALQRIKAMPAEEYQKRKEQYQQEAKLEREISMRSLRAMRGCNSEKVFVFRCLKCDAFACMSNDFRRIHDSHHVIVEDNFMESVLVEPHPRPQVIGQGGEFFKSGKIYCVKCHFDWGIQVIYKKAVYPVLKIQSFALVDCYENRLPVIKKWKNAPFEVSPFGVEDLEKKLNTSDNQLNES